ncbi:MAG: zinc ribbon domain-containing protein [Cyanobium sp. Prado107]|nr:zinc ribbon domain-containing protein [Cyanobium sp. Prado107]
MNPSRGPERLVRSGQWLIALLFAYFLIQVGGALIADLPLLSSPPQLEQFLDQPRIAGLEAELEPLQARRKALQEQADRLGERQQQAWQAYEREKASFENWRSTRSTTAQSDQNPEVIARARQLDALLQQQQQLSAEQAEITARLRALQTSIAGSQEQLRQLQAEARERFRGARQRAELRAFGIRLLFVGPLLALALWQFRRFRGTDQWPFVWGFLLFGLFAFFVELVPYLPSFGAYIRYGVGALLTFLVGRALIRWLNAYLVRKQQEQAAPQEQRQRSIRYEKALQSLGRNQCPSCERNLPRRDGELPNYCMHCGLQLQHDCSRCGFHHYACFPYCPSCGQPADGALELPA